MSSRPLEELHFQLQYKVNASSKQLIKMVMGKYQDNNYWNASRLCLGKNDTKSF